MHAMRLAKPAPKNRRENGFAADGSLELQRHFRTNERHNRVPISVEEITVVPMPTPPLVKHQTCRRIGHAKIEL